MNKCDMCGRLMYDSELQCKQCYERIYDKKKFDRLAIKCFVFIFGMAAGYVWCWNAFN